MPSALRLVWSVLFKLPAFRTTWVDGRVSGRVLLGARGARRFLKKSTLGTKSILFVPRVYSSYQEYTLGTKSILLGRFFFCHSFLSWGNVGGHSWHVAWHVGSSKDIEKTLLKKTLWLPGSLARRLSALVHHVYSSDEW